MRVANLMTTSPHVIEADQSVRHAAHVMADQDIGALLVYEGGRLAGIVTDRDLVTRGLAHGVEGSEPIRSLMTKDPVTIAPSASADDALELMVSRRIGRLCVVDDGDVKGIISFGDLGEVTRLVAEGLSRSH